MQLFQEMINIRQPAHTDFCLMLNVNPALALYLSLLSNKIRIYIVYMSHRVRGWILILKVPYVVLEISYYQTTTVKFIFCY